MADLNRKMAEGHTVSDLDTVIDEVYGAHGDYDTLGDRLDDIDTIIDTAKLGIHYKGEVNYYSNLPTTGVSIGDAYTVKYAGSSGTTPDGTEYVWGTVSGTNQWIDFSKDSYTKAEVDALLALKQNALTTAQLAAVNSGIDSTKVAQIETNKNNILSLEQMNGAKNKFNYDAWKNCGVFQGTKTVNGNSFTLVASGEDCFTYYENNEPRQYPINARIPCNAGDKVVLTWEYTPLSSQSDDRVGIFTNGSASTGFFALVSASNKKLEFTAPTGTTYLSIRFGVRTSGNSATYGNIQIQSKASYDAGFTDYQPYAMSNAELTAAIQAIQAQLANQ